MEKRLFENVTAYYKEFFQKAGKKHYDVLPQIFLLKQDFLQVFYDCMRVYHIDIRLFWENETIQKLYGQADTSVSCFIRLITELLNLASEKIGNTDHAQTIVSQAVRYIEQHLKEDITREDVAVAVGMNPDYFSKLFKKINGILISEYILNMRIDLAKKLLLSDMPVTDVAMETGFNSSSYFSTMFKKVTGMTPREYKKEI